MNTFTRFAAAAALVLGTGAAVNVAANHHEMGAHDDEHGNTIVDVAGDAGSFKTLLVALDAAELTDVLKGEGPFTVLAPTDAAFAALPEGALEGLLADPEQLAAVLTMHVVSGKAMAADVITLDEVATVQGEILMIETADGVTIGGARVVTADVEASNGVIHVIDRVILPRS